MRLLSLGVSNLRNIADLRLTLGAGFNLFVGPNGGGKTSILEAAFLLSHAQSFRAGSFDALIRYGCASLGIAGQIQRSSGSIDLRLERSSGGWDARVNGAAVTSLGALLQEFALVCLEPGSHALISGGGRERRRFLDWGVFHVEPDYLGDVRRYNRVLRQRNAALKGNASSVELDSWDAALCDAAYPVIAKRERYFKGFETELTLTIAEFLPELGRFQVSLSHGSANGDLREALNQTRKRDLMRGFTSRGPHRADWRIAFEHAPAREHLSRGQEKLCALACVLAQARLHAHSRGEWPVIAFDDLASELDQPHQRAVIDLTARAGAQVLVTGTEVPPVMQGVGATVFHVEHGRVTTLL